MIGSKVIVNASHNLHSRNNTKIVHEGSSLFVRVTSEEGGGKYSGIVGGAKITFSSKNPLKVGQSFVAVVSSKDGKIILTPKNEQDAILNQNTIISKNGNISQLLNQLGVPSDQISLHILKQLKQLQMPLENQKIIKTYGQSAKIKEKSKRAAELILMLSEKGITVNEDDLFELLSLLDGDGSADSDEDYKLINQFNSKKGHWYVFFFELERIKDGSMLGNGNLKIFMQNGNRLEKMNIMCSFNNRRFIFDCDFEEKKLKAIRLNISGVQDSRIAEVLNQISLLFSGVSVEWVDSENLLGTGCENEEFYSVNGNI